MLKNYIAFAPELILLFVVFLMSFVNLYRKEKTAKTFFTISKIGLLGAMLLGIVFYNKDVISGMLLNNTYTTFFKTIIYLLCITWFFLSCKWFLNKNRSTYEYYSLCLLAIIGFNLMISGHNLWFIFGGYFLSGLLNFFLIRLNSDDDDCDMISKNYLSFFGLFSVLFLSGILLLQQSIGSVNYHNIYEFFFADKNIDNQELLSIVLILAPLLFAMNVAPFHFWFADAVRVSILPVSGFLTLIPIFAYFCCLVDLVLNAFFPIYNLIKPALLAFAFLSLLVGAFACNKENNIRRLFAYSSIFHIGFLLLSLIEFNKNSVLSSSIYLLIYVLSASGIYTVFFGMKSNGEYLSKMRDISGFSASKPYMSAAILVFMTSLIGSPPMLGFLGKLSVVNNLIIEGRYYSLIAIMLSLLMLVTAYLQVIRVIYFENKVKNFDRSDKGIYVYLFINLVLVIISILNPGSIIQDIEKMIGSIF